jgi:hypothetical protein
MQTATVLTSWKPIQRNRDDVMMDEIMWHCRETRQPTENTNIVLRSRHGEIPEGLSGSERLACKKRSVENLGGPIDSRRTRYGKRLMRHARGNPDTELDRSLQLADRGSHPDREGREAGSGWGVRPTRSTPSAGKPRTRGRGRQSDAACKGHFNRTRRAGP